MINDLLTENKLVYFCRESVRGNRRDMLANAETFIQKLDPIEIVNVNILYALFENEPDEDREALALVLALERRLG